MEGRSRSPWKRSYICIKFYEQGIQDIVDHNRAIFEPDSEAVTEALEWLRNNHNAIIHSYDPINHQENVEIQLEIQDRSSSDEIFNEQVPSHLAANLQPIQNVNKTGITTYNQPTEISDDQLRESVRSLNKMQCKAYDLVVSWSKNKIKNVKSLKPENIQPIYLFITGGEGAGKSHLIRTIYHSGAPRALCARVGGAPLLSKCTHPRKFGNHVTIH